MDAYNPSASHEVKAVLSDGITYAGIRALTGPNVDRGYVWYDLTDDGEGYPMGACSVSIANQANGTSIQVLTTDGEVYETVCEVENSTDTLDCDEVWMQLETPEPGDDGPEVRVS
ncbi:hypothetical protein I3F58_01145 [Streptomyces sp. MUM 203J]|uniref:hypothetical protein n=1 Tax=Streptomyces sp. MUM 203J TaxID=2791990 RepID=UPI001F040552|nr:hypothetical protein [Streptomyces sp. MUM 203J]MCH0538187.1 hypothetical protein [Streptomyces sp. MUM 203J]